MPIRPDAPLTAKIVEWNDQKGYGFLQVGKGKVFLHWREFAERHKRPAVGDVIRFTGGVDAQGLTCANSAVHVNDGGRITVLAVLLLGCLLVLPALALLRRGLDFRGVADYALVIGAVSYGSYALDKRRARAKEWRNSCGGTTRWNRSCTNLARSARIFSPPPSTTTSPPDHAHST
jgi:cold shock CspA family protein